MKWAAKKGITGGTGELLARIDAEGDAPYCDVIFGGGESSYSEYKHVFQDYVSPEDANLIESCRNTLGYCTNYNLDSAILMNPEVWVATGHVSGFSDPLMDCKDCKTRHRADVAISLIQKYWGRGIGTAMFEEMIRLAKERDVEQLELEVMEGNDRAIRLYEKFGFERFGVRPNAIHLKDGTRLRELLMVKVL